MSTTLLLVSPIEFFVQGGPIMYPLLLLSLAALAVIIERLIAYKQYGDTAPGLVDQVVNLVRNGKVSDAIAAADGREGPVAKCVATILKSRALPTPLIEGKVGEVGNEYFLRLERLLPILDTTTTLSPLLGLLGTILGMVRVFQQFTAAASDEAAKARILAGVGEALYATATGIAIALVCFAAYNYFASRQRNVVAETEQAATRVMNALGEVNATAAATR